MRKEVRVSDPSTNVWDRVIRVATEYGDLYLTVAHQGGPLLNVAEKLRHEVKRQVDERIVSIAHLSRITGLSRDLISKFIRGPHECSSEKLHMLATALDLNDLLFSDWPFYGPYVEGSFVRTVIQTRKGGKRARELQRKVEMSDALIRSIGSNKPQRPVKRRRS